jgi:hypothetical protein
MKWIPVCKQSDLLLPGADLMKQQRSFRAEREKQRGAILAETPAAIWLAFIGLFFPLFCLATCLLRFAFLETVSHQAAYDAALAKTFQTDVSTTDLSAVTTAVQTANTVAASFSGIAVQSVNTRIIQTDSQTSAVQVYTNKLPAPANTTRYVYLIETTVVGSIKPLIAAQGGMFQIVSIPGLTAPMVVQATSRKVAENPQGLNL